MATPHSTVTYRFNQHRWRLDLSNVPDGLAQQLHDAGWDVHVLWDGSVGLLHPRSQSLRDALALLAEQGFGWVTAGATA
jgi:hypothetical protein